MQELITEIAIYLGLAAFLGLVLGYLIWGLGQRRRIDAARAEAAAGARTTVDGSSPLRTQIESLSRERDRLEHRVELLSARVASLLESQEAETDASDAGERLGAVRMRMTEDPGDPMDRAAEAFPRPADAEPAERSIFAPDGAPDAPKEPRPEPATASDTEAPAVPRARFIRRSAIAHRNEDSDASAARGDDSTATDGPAPEKPVANPAPPDLAAAAAALRESLEPDEAAPPGDTAPAAPVREKADAPTPDDRPAILLASPPDAPDDLTRIKGIGKSTEAALNANGIWLFRQLAEMSEADAEWIRTAIGGLPGRIARDRWSEQARALLDETGKGD